MSEFSPLKNYNARLVTFVWGNIQADGVADGEWLTAESDEDDTTLYVGTDGSATLARNNNFSGTITVRLAQSSATNDAYSAEHTLFRNGPPGSGIHPMLIRDASGRTVLQAQSCWIQKRPPVTFGREATEREWTFRTNNLITNIAGN